MTTTNLSHVQSYGILLYREGATGKKNKKQIEVFLIKPNGPHFWNNPKITNVWGIPKGRVEGIETPIQTAHREFYEEVGMRAPEGLDYAQLPPFVTYRGKTITIFTADASGKLVSWKGSNTATGEHPPQSGTMITYAETSGGGWFSLEEALNLIGSGQRAILHSLRESIRANKRALALA